MPNAGAGAGNLPGYSDLADRQTGVGRGRHPLDGPALSHPGSRRSFSCATPGPRPRQRAYGVSRPVRAYGQIALSANGQSERWHNDVRHSLRSDTHRALWRQKSGNEDKKVQRRREIRVVIPGAAIGPGVGRGSFCRLLPAYGQEQAVYFVRLAPPQDANHTVCALINHTND